MKNFLFVMGSLVLALLSALPIEGAPMKKEIGNKIMVISDPHLLAPSLIGDGKASQHLATSDMKLVLESDMIIGHMVDEMIKEKPDFVLITGDLTFNGARASHEQMVRHLERLSQAGIRCFVIPGNHDVNCPYSKSYIGDVAEVVETIGSEDFAQLYSYFGYGKGSELDSNSLSYTCELVPGLVLLCIDSNLYNDNQLGAQIVYHNDGIVKPKTLEWIKKQLAKAKSGGKRVIALMHHHLVEHIDGESKLLPNYIVANHEEVSQVLRDGGVKVVFTGHLHITDAAICDGIVDVATGSASTYPLPIRTLTIDPSLEMLTIDTRFFDGLDEGVLLLGKHKIENGADALAALVSRRLWSKMKGRMEQLKLMLAMQGMEVKSLPQDAQELSELLLRHLREPLTHSLVSVSRGGEDPQQAAAVIDAIRQGVRGMVLELIPENGEMIVDFLISELMPRVEPMLRSALEDINQVGSDKESKTDDHRLKIIIK